MNIAHDDQRLFVEGKRAVTVPNWRSVDLIVAEQQSMPVPREVNTGARRQYPTRPGASCAVE